MNDGNYTPTDPIHLPWLQSNTLMNMDGGGVISNHTEHGYEMEMFHHDGGFLRFRPREVALHSPRHFRFNIQKNLFHTVGKNYRLHVKKNMEMKIEGDFIFNSGDALSQTKAAQEYLKVLEEIAQLKQEFETNRANAQAEDREDIGKGSQQQGTAAKDPATEAEHKTITVNQYPPFVPAKIEECAVRTIMEIKPVDVKYEDRSIKAERSVTGGGTGVSPSSQDGNWTPNVRKDTISQLYGAAAVKLAEHEKEMGTSLSPEIGQSIFNIGGNLAMSIGHAFNTLPAYRRDSIGRLSPFGLQIDPDVITKTYAATPHYEVVHVDPMLGGAMDLNVCDHMNITVGSGGVSLKTIGQMQLYSPMLTIAAEDLQVSSRGELGLRAQRVDIQGDVITLRPNKHRHLEGAEESQHVLIDGAAHINGNAIIAGGAHIEGGITTQHITAPLEWQITQTDFENVEGEKKETRADLEGGHHIGQVIITQGSSAGTYPVISVCKENCIVVHPHFHYFPSPAMKLVSESSQWQTAVNGTPVTGKGDPNQTVRAVGTRSNSAKRNQAQPIEHSKDENSVVTKQKVKIDDGGWSEPTKADKRPVTEGTDSEKYQKNLCALKDIIEKILSTKFWCLKDDMSNNHKLQGKSPYPSKDEDGGGNQTGTGTGRIRTNDGSSNFAGQSNIEVGNQDPDTLAALGEFNTLIETLEAAVKTEAEQKCE